MTPVFTSWSDFFAMNGYALYVWLAVAMSIISLVVLILHSVLQRRAILRGIAQRRMGEARMRVAQV